MLIVECHLKAVTQKLVGKDIAPIGELLKKIDELKAQRDELLEACEGLMAAFVHVEGDVKGNKARTDIFKHGQGKGGMAEAANKARVAIAKARG